MCVKGSLKCRDWFYDDKLMDRVGEARDFEVASCPYEVLAERGTDP
jgi:hypothetical protein